MLPGHVLPLLLVASLAHAQSAPDLLVKMKRAWETLSSYKTGQIIQERVRGELGPEQKVRVKFRKPWEIQLEWETLHPGRKVYWNAARHDGEVQVYPGGFTGRTLGILSFALDNSILKRDTNYTPAAGGFGYLIETIAKTAEGTKRPTASQPVAGTVRGEAVWSVALAGIDNPRYQKAELVVSAASGLPVRFTSWTNDGTLAERYEWYETVIDLKLDDKTDFDVGYR